MKREIKFRAWSKKTNDWCDHGSAEWFFSDGGGPLYSSYDSEHTELMQYTGLKDKNGKEIYEGDVVEVEDGPNKKKREIVFKDGAFSLKLLNGATEYLPNYVRYGQIEVIGNIYENPELLDAV